MSAYDTLTAGLSGLGLVLAGLVAIYGTSDYHRNAQQLENDLLNSSVLALEQSGLDWARVRIDGQTAFLSGAAPSIAAQDQAIAVVSQTAGPGGFWRGGIMRVETDFTQGEAVIDTSPYIWRATKTAGGEIILLGSVPSESVRQSLKRQAAMRADMAVQDRLDVRRGAPDDAWSQMAAFGLENLHLLDSGEARITDLEMRLSGVALLDASRIQVTAAVANISPPWTGIAMITGPSHWQAAHVDDTLVLSGACESDAQCAEIVSIAGDYFAGDVINQMQVAASDYEPWINGVRAGLPHFTQFETGAMRFAPETDGFAFEGEASTSTLQFLQQDMAQISGPYAVTVTAARLDIELAELENVTLDANPLIACQRAFDLVMAANKVTFETASAEISRVSGLTLDKIMAVSDLCETNLRFEIVGHSDNVGERDANVRLSGQRAQAVANYMSDAGFDTSRLVVTGRGPDQAIADNSTSEGRAANRRIEFSVQEWSE